MDISAPASARVRKAARARQAVEDDWNVLGEIRIPDIRLRNVRLPEMRLPRVPDVSGTRARLGEAATGLHARATLAVSLVREAVGR
jgi:hypothetical protein